MLATSRAEMADLRRLMDEIEAQPTADLKRETGLAFYAPLRRWAAEVLYEAGVLKTSARENAHELATLLDKEPPSAEDLERLLFVWQALRYQVVTLIEMAGVAVAKAPSHPWRGRTKGNEATEA